jgi:multidrug efflux pump subunit AcrB
MAPAVSIAIAKRNGANAVNVSEGVVARVEALKGALIPAGVAVSRATMAKRPMKRPMS